MGKLRKGRRNQRGRINPVARKDGSTPSKQDIKDETTRQNKIVPLIGQLSSSAPNDRSVALNAITVLSEDSRLRKLLLKERLIPVIMEQTLNDSNDELVVESFGLLRNLTIEEGYEVAKYLWRSNIWSAIESALSKVQSTLQFLASDKKLDQKRTYMFYDFVENILSLIVLIASCSQDLYESIYSKIEPVVTLTIDILNWNCQKLRSVKLVNVALDFLYEFSSDSAEFVISLAKIPSFDLNKLAEAVNLPTQESNILGKVYIEGLRFHFMEVQGNYNTTKNDACSQVIQKLFSIISPIDLNEVKLQLSTTDNAEQPLKKPTEDEKPRDVDVPFGGESAEKTLAKSYLQAIEISLDLLTSICELLALNEQDPLQSVSLEENVTSVLLATAYSSCLHLLKFDRENEHILKLTLKLLVAFNNMSWLFLSCSTIPVEWFNKIPDLWLEIELSSQSDDLEIQKTTLSIMWAITKVVGPEIREKISLENVKALLLKSTNIISASTSEEDDQHVTFEFLLSAVGFLGSIAQVLANVDITGEVAEFLFSLILHFIEEKNNFKNTKAMEIPVECLNLLYDIFGDAEYSYDEPIFVGRNYIERLEQLEPEIKSFYKKIDKKRSTELKLRAEEAWMNLPRFIEYKKSERV